MKRGAIDGSPSTAVHVDTKQRREANACAERLQPRPDRTSPSDRPGWCTSGLSAGYAPSKRNSERSLPVASGRTRGADSPGHLLPIALISTPCTALISQGRALHGVACAVSGLCHTREKNLPVDRQRAEV